MIRLSKKNYYNTFFTENSNNLKESWKGIKTLINIKDQKLVKPSSIVINYEICSDPNKISSTFNNYFSTIGEKLQKKIYNAGKGYDNYLINPNDKTFYIYPTNAEELVTTITSLQLNKGTCPNSIPGILLHSLRYELAPLLAKIANLTFETGMYINKLKISKVIPRYKDKGSKTERSNYGPISLLSNLNI